MNRLIQIADAKKPGDFLLIDARDFDPTRHVLFGKGEAPASPAPIEPAPAKRTRKGKP